MGRFSERVAGRVVFWITGSVEEMTDDSGPQRS
jgi:hypothetical protein